MSPTATEPSDALRTAIINQWGSVSNFLDQFSASAAGNFGSGWTWLVKQGTDIKIVNTSNARNPMNDNLVPLLTVDIW
jgi:Fe-Mn family superoxide dismutase